ncbi:MAG: hypothetical protein AB1716_02550 [Planctomycetota bacterium]
MFRFMAIMLLLAAGTPALAGVEVFFTNSADPYGLTRPANAFEPTKGLRTDVTSGDYILRYAPPMNVGTPTINYAAGEFAYMWLRFVNEIPGMKLWGLDLRLDGMPADVAWYIVDDTAGTILAGKRWDGVYTPPNFLEFKNAHQVLVAVTTYGLKNLGVSHWNLYDGPTRTHLIGAVRYDVSGTFSGQSFRPITPPWIPWWEPLGPVGSAVWIPEPAALTLACVLACFLRRRRRLARAPLPNVASARASGEP